MPAVAAIFPSAELSKRAKRLSTKQGTLHSSSYIRSGTPNTRLLAHPHRRPHASLYTLTIYKTDRFETTLSKLPYVAILSPCASSSSTTITEDCLSCVHGTLGLPVLKQPTTRPRRGGGCRSVCVKIHSWTCLVQTLPASQLQLRAS